MVRLLGMPDAEALRHGLARGRISVSEAAVMTDANEQAPKVLDLPIGLDASGMRRGVMTCC